MPRRKAPSRKALAILLCESAQEDEAAVRFEACPSVKGILVQPCKIPYFLDGKRRVTTPDFELELADQPSVLVEVKHSKQASRPDIARKLAAIQASSEALGHPYYVITDRWIRVEPVLENLRILLRWRSATRVSGYNPLLEDVLEELPLRFRAVGQRLGSRATAAAYVLANRLHMNLLEDVTESSFVLRVPHRATAVALELPWRTPEGRQIWGAPR